jgi:hypothetical protein
MTGRSDSRLKTRGLSGSDVKGLLEVLVQDIEETVCETPHEEEDSDERHLLMSVVVMDVRGLTYGDDGLLCRDLASAGDSMVIDTLSPGGILHCLDC